MKAIRPLLLVGDDLRGHGTEDVYRRVYQLTLPDGTLLYEYDPHTEKYEVSVSAFERLLTHEATES